MKITSRLSYHVHGDPSLHIYLMSKSDDYDMHSMQLFIKVEEAATGQPYVTSPKFYQVTTSCEFSLIQALENILGGDLVHYEIVGPGSWVKWTTLAKEIKGQQLTLLYHNEPVAHTKSAIYGPIKADTDLRQPVTTQNIPASMDTIQDDETHLKVFDYTQIENLKYVPDSSVPDTDSNNMSLSDLSDSLGNESRELESVLPEVPPKTNTYPTLENQDEEFTVNSQTHGKVSVLSKNNIPEHSQMVKCFSDKLLSQDITSMSDSCDISEQDLLQVLNNVPRFSILEQDSSMSSQTHVKVSVVSKNNIPEYSQVVKTFPNKLLLHDVTRMSDSLDMVTEQNPLQVLKNVPHFSILAQNLSSASSNAQTRSLQTTHNLTSQANQNPTFQSECGKKYNNLNNLNYVPLTSNPDSSFVQNSQVFPNNTDSATPISVAGVRPGIIPSQVENTGDNTVNIDRMPDKSSVFSGAKVVISDTKSAASSLFTQGRNIQHINVTMCPPSVDYVPHTCIQTVGGQLQNVSSVVNPSHCGSSGLVVFPPQKRHIPGGIIPSPVTSPEQLLQHHQLQQQALLEIQALELKELQLQQIQQQRVQTSQQNEAFSIGYHSAVNPQNHYLHQIHLQSHFSTVSQTVSTQQQQTTYLEQSYPNKLCENSSHQNWETKPQSLHQFSQQQLQLHLQRQQQQCEIKSLDQPHLICHTPPPSFPEQMQHNIHSISGIGQRQLKQPPFNTFVTQSNPESQSVEQGSHILNMDTRPEQYTAMFQSSPDEIGNPGNMSSPFKSQCTVLHKPTSMLLPGIELTVRLPQPDTNTRPSDSHLFLNSRNKSSASSNSTSAGSGGKFALNGCFFMNGEEQSPFTTSETPSTDVLSSHIQTQAISGSVATRKQVFNEIITMDEEGYNLIDNGQVPRSRPQLVSQWPSPATPKRAGLSLDTELLHMEGWCPQENGDTIQNTMEKYRSQDGSFIIWKSRRYMKFIISVSHLNQLFHFRVEEIKHENRDRTVYYLFEGGFRSESLLDLIQHYRQNGLRISVQSPGRVKTYIEHIGLRYPVKSEVRRKDTSRSS